MKRETGTYRVTKWENEEVQAFVPTPLPPAKPPLALDDDIRRSLSAAMNALGKLAIAADMVPNAEWFLYGFVRKEALITSQIEGTQATLQDVLAFEAGEKAGRPEDVREVCNYVDALTFARDELARPDGLPLATRLFCNIHKRLMDGVRGSEKQPGEIRRRGPPGGAFGLLRGLSGRAAGILVFRADPIPDLSSTPQYIFQPRGVEVDIRHGGEQGFDHKAVGVGVHDPLRPGAVGILRDARGRMDQQILQGRGVRILPADSEGIASGPFCGLFALITEHAHLNSPLWG